MSGIMHALQEKISSLHPKERVLAAFILKKPQLTVRLGIAELAEQSGTSTATVSRFCRSFHFSGYADFKMKLAEELAQQPLSESYQDIVAGNALAQIVSAMEANHLRSITDTTRLVDQKQLRNALDALRSARQIDIYGMATSGLVAQDFYQKLTRIGKRATAFVDTHMQITSASTLASGDVALAISYSGETPETIDALNCAKENGARTISLTKFGANTLSRLADVQLFTSTLEEGMRRGDMASRIAQLHVIDILFTALVSECFGEFVPRLEASYQMVKKYRKEKEGDAMNILKFRTQEELNTAGAGIIAGLIQTNPRAVLGLATGSTPVGIYEELVKLHRKGMVSFRSATTFNLDEYVGLSEDHPESYHSYMQEHLLRHIDLPAEQTHIPDGNAPDPLLECRRYDDLLERAKQIDLQLLGLGHNGHIGFNEPDNALSSGTHMIKLREETRQANARFFDTPEQVPTHALTMGVGTILKAKMILLVVRGADKAEVVHRALNGPITTECPASLLQTHPHLVVLLDAEAGRHFDE